MNRQDVSWGCRVAVFFLFTCGCANGAADVATSSDGVEISFEQLGKGDPALVFIHGWSNNASVWDAQMSHFSGKYRVIAVDLPGFGASGHNRTNWTMAVFGEDVAAVIKKLNLEKVVLVGFSMGGPVAIEAAKASPDNVIGLALVDVLQNVETKYSPETIAQVRDLLMDLVTNPTNEKAVGGGFYKKNPEASFKRVLAMLSANRNTSRIGWRESLDDFFRWSNEDCIESLKKVRVPVVSINSDSEPTNVEAFKKYLPSYQLKIVPDVAHLVMWDNPEEFNRLLEESIQEFINARINRMDRINEE